MKKAFVFIWNKFLGMIYSIIKPISKYGTTVSDDLIVKQIPKQEPVLIEAFCYMVVEPNNIFEITECKDDRVTLTQLSTGKVIKLRTDIFNLNFKPVRHINTQILNKIINDSKKVTK